MSEGCMSLPIIVCSAEDPGDSGQGIAALGKPDIKSEETPTPNIQAGAQNGSNQGSYCCYVALTMAARVLDASTARETVQRVRSGVNLDDLILNIKSLKPPTESQPRKTGMLDKPGYHHVYALLGCLMATAYVNQRFAIQTLYLDRAISNLEIAAFKMPDTPFKEFRQYL
jgi:hypothetical protein